MRHEPLPISNLSEYQVLFNLTPEDLDKKIIDFPAGLNSFSAEMVQQNYSVVACDKIYADSLQLKRLAKKIGEDNQHDRHKIAAIEHFKKDFPHGFKKNRYIPLEPQAAKLGAEFTRDLNDSELENSKEYSPYFKGFPTQNHLKVDVKSDAQLRSLRSERYTTGKLPQLPFSNHQFDLLLCSFFFFFNGDDLADYWDNLLEMLRIATEVRIAPLISAQNPAKLLGPLMLKLQTYAFGIEVRSINFSSLPASAMLRVWSQHCQII